MHFVIKERQIASKYLAIHDHQIAIAHLSMKVRQIAIDFFSERERQMTSNYLEMLVMFAHLAIQADRAYGSEICQRSFVISFVILYVEYRTLLVIYI
jgi:hypothetical protein